jgi:hypothetical protein
MKNYAAAVCDEFRAVSSRARRMAPNRCAACRLRVDLALQLGAELDTY